MQDLAHENRILRTLHKRQDSALAKYESTNAELPKLLHSHAEELRVWQAKYRNLQQLNKELEHKLKTKESIILTLSDQNKYYSQLNKDRWEIFKNLSSLRIGASAIKNHWAFISELKLRSDVGGWRLTTINSDYYFVSSLWYHKSHERSSRYLESDKLRAEYEYFNTDNSLDMRTKVLQA